MTEPISRIEAALARLGEEHEPPPGWEARVLAVTALQAQPQPPSVQPHPEPPAQRRWWWVMVPTMALAAAAVLVLVVVRPPTPSQLALNIAIEQPAGQDHPVQRGVESSIARSADPRPGVIHRSTATQNQTIHATAVDGGPEHALWIYRNEKLIIRCPGSAECRGADEAVFRLELTGVYQVVALSSRSALPTIAIGDLLDPTIAQLPDEVVRQRHEITVR